MLWYVVKYKNNNKKTSNRTKQDKKSKGKWIPFVKELLLSGKSVVGGKSRGDGRKEKRKKRADSSVGEVSPVNWQRIGY